MLELDFGAEGFSKGADIQSAAEKIKEADEVRGSDVRVAFYPSQSFIESNNDPLLALDLQGAIRNELAELPTARDVTKQSNLDQLNVDEPSRATIDPGVVAVAAELDRQFTELDGYVQREGTNIELVDTAQGNPGGGSPGGGSGGGGKPGGGETPGGQPTTGPVEPLPEPVPVGPGDLPPPNEDPGFPVDLPAPGEPIPGPIDGTMPGPFLPPGERPPNERPPDFIPMPGRPPPRVDPNPGNQSPGQSQAGMSGGRLLFFGGVSAILLYLVNQ